MARCQPSGSVFACGLASPFQVACLGVIPRRGGVTGYFLTGGRVPAAGQLVVGAPERHGVLCAVPGSTSVFPAQPQQVLVSLCDLVVAKRCFHICLAGYGRLLECRTIYDTQDSCF